MMPGKAYHDIPGVPGDVYRPGSDLRAQHIADYLDVDGKRGIDIGCSVGGISFALADRGACMYGVDYDESSIAVAVRAQADRPDLNLCFRTMDLRSDEVWEDICAERFDFAVWLSQWMWLAKQDGMERAKRRLRQLSTSVPALVFETAQGPHDGAAGSREVTGPAGVRDLLRENTTYGSIRSIGVSPGNWLSGRSVFLCR